MEQEIAAFLRERGFSLAANADLKAELLSGGNSHVTWRVRVTDSRSGRLAHDLVVKVAQRDGPLAPYDVGHEYEMMRFANATSIPTPQPIGFSTSADESKMSFIVMGFVDGDVPSLSTL